MAPAEHRMFAAARRLSAHLRPSGDHRGARPPFVPSYCLLASARCRSPFRRLDEAAGGVCEPRAGHNPGHVRGAPWPPPPASPISSLRGPEAAPAGAFRQGRRAGPSSFLGRAGARRGPSGPDEKAPSTGSVTGCWIERRPMIIIRQRATAKRAMARRLIMALPGITTVTIRSELDRYEYKVLLAF